MVSWSDVVTWLAALSSIAVILGVGFIVLQLRQNARLLETTLRQQRSDVAVTILERLTDPSWPKRRSQMFTIVAQFQATNWKDAWESPEDLEVRDFAYIYELLGVMVQQGLVDLQLLAAVLQGMVVRDWKVFAPHARWVRDEFRRRSGPGVSAFDHFEWLAEETQRLMMANRPTPSPS